MMWWFKNLNVPLLLLIIVLADTQPVIALILAVMGSPNTDIYVVVNQRVSTIRSG